VVEMGIVEVTTVVESAGQLVTVGAQLVIVISLVVYTVEVVHLGGELDTGAEEVTGELPLGPAGLVTGELPLGPAGTLSVGEDPAGAVSVEEDPAGAVSVGVEPAGVVSVTGHTVVEMGIVEVTTVVESAGQLVTVGAQLVIVISLVVYTVEVVHLGGALEPGVIPAAGEVTGELPLGPAGLVTGELPLGPAGLEADPAGTDSVEEDPAGAVSVGIEPAGVVSVTGHTVVEMAMVEVTTVVESAGQLVTVGAQLVIVISLVVYTVEVVHLGGALEPGVIPAAGEVTGELPLGPAGTE
jgi:ribosomal 50S subunit-recycling heat shock protein